MTSTFFKKCVAFALTFALIMSNVYIAPATTDAATKVSLNKKSVSLTVAQDGEKISYGTATLKVKKGKKVKVKKTTYKVADTDIATVNKNGKITAKKTGTTKVNVTVNYKLKKKSYKKTLKCNVKVNNTYKNVLDNIKLNYANYATYVGAVTGVKPSYVSKVKLNDDFYLFDCLKITVEDPSIVKLGDAGYLMGLKEGSTKVTVTTTDGSNISRTSNVRIYAKAEDVPEQDDVYLTEHTKLMTELYSKWTEEDKVRYTDENGNLVWNYATEAQLIYDDRLNQIIDTYKKAGKQEDNTSKDVLQSVFSTTDTMYTKEGEEAYYKDIKENLIDPVIETKSIDELLKLTSEYSKNGINSILDSSATYHYYVNNMEIAKEIELKNQPAPDTELDTTYYYCPSVCPVEVFSNTFTSESSAKGLEDFISSSFKLLNIEDTSYIKDTVDIAKTMPKYDMSSSEQPVKLSEFKNKYPRLFIAFSGNEYDVNDDTTIYVSNENILSKLEGLLGSESNLNALKGYVIASICHSWIGYGISGKEIIYKYMLGDEVSQYTPAEIKEESTTQHEALLDGIDVEIPYDIDYVYTHTYYSENYKSELDKMIDLFVEQYKESISSSWMDESTKAAMLDKVNKMKFSSLYPTEEEYKNLCISDDLKNVEEGGRFFNTLSSIRKNHQHLTRMTINHNVKDMHWWSPTKYLFGGVKPWEANAFFDYYLNQVFLCHMFLANIFVDNPDNSKEIDLMNLGYMAGTIGHEMGHAFDDTGNRFNSKGNIINTWSDKDADTYLGKVDKLSKIFDSTFAGCDYNRNTAFYQKGFNVVNESMADLGGLEIGIEICKKKYPNDDEALKKMYSYYAKQWVTTDEDKMDDYKLSWRFDDPHPMYRNRANTILSMTDDFYRVYNIKESDAMYIAPEDRVKIWK